MKAKFEISAFVLALVPAICSAQYDYNQDLAKAVEAHYPPLVSLLITKGAKVDTQDENGRTPLMTAIRTRDSEITKLLLKYDPNISLLDIDNHSAAIEAVLNDDADVLPSVLLKSNRLQVAQSIALAVKRKKNRAYNKFVEMMGAPLSEEIGRRFLAKPLQYFEAGSQVSFYFQAIANLPDVCGARASRFLLQGEICEATAARVSVRWRQITNLKNEDRLCSDQTHIRWERRNDAEWNAKFLGDCGSAPTYFQNVPSVFSYTDFIVPELR
jgi:hypothetical protein